MPSAPTYIFSGGGTGGHLYPGIAVAQELERREPGVKILFVGSDRQVEQRIIESNGFAHWSLQVRPLSSLRRQPWEFVWRNWSAWREARRIISTNRPSVVIGLGGFASAPLVLAARCGNIPSLLLEQNAVPGRATRWLIRHSSRCCVSFERAGECLRLQRRLPRWPSNSQREISKVMNTGNPVRRAISELCRPDPRSGKNGPPMLLVLGGSQGATALNDAMASLVARVAPLTANWRIVHQTGSRDLDQVAQAYRHRGIDVRVAAFFDDLPDLYRQASLVVTRGGATTLAELACAGIPAIVVPYPQATDNHQFFNADAYAEQGAALIAAQANSAAKTTQNICEHLWMLLSHPGRLSRMRSAMQALARPEAAQAVADQILFLSQLHRVNRNATDSRRFAFGDGGDRSGGKPHCRAGSESTDSDSGPGATGDRPGSAHAMGRRSRAG